MTTVLKAVLTAIALVMAPLASGIIVTPVAAQPVEPASKTQIATQVMTNLKVVDVMARAGAQALRADETVLTFTPAEQDRLVKFYTDGMYAQAGALNAKLAASCADDFTMDDLKILLRLSQIKYIQQLVAAGGDPSLTSDPSTMSPDEQAFVTQYADSDIVARLAAQIDFNVIKPELEAITLKAFSDFLAWRAQQPA